MSPTLTVIVPVFNEAETIDVAFRRVFTSPYDKQVIAVDDGSTDGTADALYNWQDQVLVLTHRENRGKGAAIRTALAHATGRFVIIQDADLETDPHDYPKLIEPLLAGEADFVIGSRFLATCKRTSRWSPFRLGIDLLNFCIRILYGVRLSDEACCYKALSTDVLRQMNLECERFEFCPEVVAKACRLRLRFCEVPIHYSPRTRAAGKKIRCRDGVQALLTL